MKGNIRRLIIASSCSNHLSFIIITSLLHHSCFPYCVGWLESWGAQWVLLMLLMDLPSLTEEPSAHLLYLTFGFIFDLFWISFFLFLFFFLMLLMDPLLLTEEPGDNCLY